VHACWKFVQPILAYKANRGQLYSYDPGSWGPTEADKMIARSGRVWRQPK
jgi:glucose-6-phosphate dehydrogenase, C-terminal domain